MPTQIVGTSRQRVTTRSGVELERAYIFMPKESWDALQRLCVTSHRSGSQVIENLVAIASSSGKLKDTNDKSSPRSE